MEARLIFKDCASVDDCILKLNALIESWPVVYGTKDNNGQHFHENPNGNYNPTHKARLAFIEEIVKECKHEPNVLNQKLGGWFCKTCGVEIYAEWKEIKP